MAKEPAEVSAKRERQIIGFSLPPLLASKVKAEAARRKIRLTDLFKEMWKLYERQQPNNK